jgi:hypothetical protein
MVGFVREWVAENFLADSVELLNSELDKAKSFVAYEHLVWISAFPSDHH